MQKAIILKRFKNVKKSMMKAPSTSIKSTATSTMTGPKSNNPKKAPRGSGCCFGMFVGGSKPRKKVLLNKGGRLSDPLLSTEDNEQRPEYIRP